MMARSCALEMMSSKPQLKSKRDRPQLMSTSHSVGNRSQSVLKICSGSSSVKSLRHMVFLPSDGEGEGCEQCGEQECCCDDGHQSSGCPKVCHEACCVDG